MAQQLIGIGAVPDDGTGDPLRTSFDKTNQNFTELYTAEPLGADQTITVGTTGDVGTIPEAFVEVMNHTITKSKSGQTGEYNDHAPVWTIQLQNQEHLIPNGAQLNNIKARVRIKGDETDSTACVISATAGTAGGTEMRFFHCEYVDLTGVTINTPVWARTSNLHTGGFGVVDAGKVRFNYQLGAMRGSIIHGDSGAHFGPQATLTTSPGGIIEMNLRSNWTATGVVAWGAGGQRLTVRAHQQGNVRLFSDNGSTFTINYPTGDPDYPGVGAAMNSDLSIECDYNFTSANVNQPAVGTYNGANAGYGLGRVYCRNLTANTGPGPEFPSGVVQPNGDVVYVMP